MPDRRDIPEALREAVERTVQATVGTRDLAQGAASELSASVDELVKGAEKGITRSGRTVRAAVEERLPAGQDDMKAIRAELRRIGKRLDAIEDRLPARKPAKAATATKRTPAKTAKARPAAKGKPAKATKAGSAAKPKPAGRRRAKAGSRAKPQR